MDIEFLVQYLQIVNAPDAPEVLRPNIWEALDALRRAGLLDPEDHSHLRDAYDFLRAVEARLRIVHNRTDVGLPEGRDDLARLARRLGYEAHEHLDEAALFRSDIERLAAVTRSLLERTVGPVHGAPPR